MNAPAPHRHVVLTAGYTAGHVYPAVAVAEAWRRLEPETRFTFVGSADGIESQLAIDLGFDFADIPARPVMRSSKRDALRGMITLARGTLAARRLLKRLDPDFVMGFGGYATPGAIVAGRTLGIPTAIHEANTVPGRANRLAGRFVGQVFLNRPEGADRFPPDKIRLVGQPLRADIRALCDVARDPPQADALNLLILGGSLGMAFLNANGPDLAAALGAHGLRLTVRHQTGAEGDAAVRESYRAAGLEATVMPFIDDMAAAFRWADWALAPAGAGTLAELAVAGLPATIVPLADAADAHQAGNADAFRRDTGLTIRTESDWQTDHVARDIVETTQDPERYRQIVDRLRGSATGDAATEIAQIAIASLKASP